LEEPGLPHEFTDDRLAGQFLGAHPLRAFLRHAVLLERAQHAYRRWILVAAAELRGAGAEHLNEAKAGVLQRFLDGRNQSPNVPYGVAGNVAGPCCCHQTGKVEGWLRVAGRRRHGPCSARSGGGHLPSGHAEDRIVGTDDRHVHVAPRSMDQVIATD